MLILAAGIAVFRIEVPSSEALTLVGSGLTGLGLGATVAPALFVAGFSLPAANLQRVFAIVELLRAVRGLHGRADLHPSGGDDGRKPCRRHRHRPVDRARTRDRRCRQPASPSTRSAAHVRKPANLELFPAGRDPRPGTRRRCWREFARTWPSTTPASESGRLTCHRVSLALGAPSGSRHLRLTTAPSSRRFAIEQAGRQLAPGQEALVVLRLAAGRCRLRVSRRSVTTTPIRHLQSGKAAEGKSPHRAQRWRSGRDFRSQSAAVWAATDLEGDRRDPPTSANASLIVNRIPPAVRASWGTWSAASPLPSSRTRHAPCSSSTSAEANTETARITCPLLGPEARAGRVPLAR